MELNKNLKIFLVDDDPFCIAMYEQYLLGLGYTNIVTFSNGQDCLNQLTSQPDIIFLDHHMEPYTGLELLKKIKRVNPDIFLIILSGQEDMQVTINALKYGAFDYVIKTNGDVGKIEMVLQKIQTVRQIMAIQKPTRLSGFFSFLNFI